MAKLRKMLTHPGKNESGQGALAMVLLLLMLGAVILTPLLVFMSTGVKAGQVYESKLQEFYAADAGVEDAIWKINNGSLSVPADYLLDEEVNDRNVSVTIEDEGGGFYKINSTATSDTGGNTTIECYVFNIPSFFNLFDNAITSNGTICVKGDVNGTTVAEDCTPQPGCDNTNCTELGELEDPIIWPSELQLSTYYWKQVKNLTPYSDDRIDIDTDPIIGPLYRDGTLDIYNSGSVGKNATLNGTVYVTGDTKIGTAPHPFTLNLNGQTIFVESASVDPQEAIEIGGKCTITGSGCIIAVGDIYFAPDGDVGSEGEFVFIMSIKGTVTLQPSGEFYGAVAGDVEVMQRPGLNPDIIWIYPGDGDNFNFPTETVGELTVLSYTIK